jgi:hypothetical protein
MRSYEILGQASQSSRRTIADALAVLETEAAFGEDDTAQIRIGHLRLPSRETVGLVLIVFDMPCTDKSYAVPLPTAKQFYADNGSSRRVLFDVGLFDEAVADSMGNVFLTTGETLLGWDISLVGIRRISRGLRILLRTRVRLCAREVLPSQAGLLALGLPV